MNFEVITKTFKKTNIMSKNIFLAFITIIISLSSCKEVPQEVVLDPSQLALFDTTYISSTPIAPFPNNVLMEEFSGVRCVNCPEGNAKTKALHSANPSRVTIVTVHSNFLASPIGTDQDLRCVDANALVDALGPIGGKPTTFINRKKLEDPLKLVISGAGPAKLNSWETYVNNELALSTPIGLDLELIFSEVAERKFRYRVTIKFSESSSNINLGFLLTESGMETEQDAPNSQVIEDYEHEWVLRDFITSILGEPLTEDLQANTVIIKEFEIDLDDSDFNPTGNWKIDNMELVAFLRASDESIINVAKVEL